MRATDNVGQWRDYIYDPNGNLIGEGLRSGNTAIEASGAEYSLQDRKTSSTNTGGFRTSVEHDNVGNVVRITNPDNYSVGVDYDPANHWTRAVDGAGNAVTKRLGLDGRPRSITDPNGNASTYEFYDAGSQRCQAHILFDQEVQSDSPSFNMHRHESDFHRRTK